MKNTQELEFIMNEFASRTNLYDLSKPCKRYLWTDAFAVCNFLELYCQTKNEHYKDLSLLLIERVHSVLGCYHNEDVRKGCISGHNDAKLHPTLGGLRIGKKLPERAIDEPYDEKKEWDRDGQYFHYLTKWMHALNQAASVTKDTTYIRWAVELAKTAHKAFTYQAEDGKKRMYWKMSTDLSRPLVSSMGQHDALDAYISYLKLSATASEFNEDADLSKEIEEAHDMMVFMQLETDDSLGLGGLLSDACQVTQLIIIYKLPLEKLLISLLNAAANGIERFIISSPFNYPAQYRLPFRELGLSIGMHGVKMMRDLFDVNIESFNDKETINESLLRLQSYMPLAKIIEEFWIDAKHQLVSTWTEHIDINTIMLATSIAPNGFLKLKTQI